MAFGVDSGGAILRFVTRAVSGDIFVEKTRFDTKEMKNVKTIVKLKDPVIVFMPNKSTRVMSMKEAEKLGFLQRPDIINFEAITDAKTVAGKFKFAFSDRERAEHWKELEQQVISRCIQSHGYPIPREASVSDESLHFMKEAV